MDRLAVLSTTVALVAALAGVALGGAGGVALVVGGSAAGAALLRTRRGGASQATVTALRAAFHRLAAGQPRTRIDGDIAGIDTKMVGAFNVMARAVEIRAREAGAAGTLDAETGLPNVLSLQRRLEAGSDEALPLFVVSVGIDRFARVRRTIGFGRAALLVADLGRLIAERVPDAHVARLDPDVLAVAFRAPHDAAALALLPLLQGVDALSPAHGVDVTVTVGLAGPADDAPSPALLIERSRIALDQARAGHARVTVFNDGAFGDPNDRLTLMQDLRHAIAREQLFLYYQPKLRSRTGTIDGAEALMRWRHPTRGLIPPDTFIPMAEETGDIRAMTEWALETVIADQCRLAAEGFPTRIYVNVSARLLGDGAFAQAAMRIVAGHASEIGFEITETAVIDDPERALANLHMFADGGIRIAIDDYGSGMSSLAYLKQLPAHELKIDKMFVSGLTQSHRDPMLVRSTIDLAHGLGLEVTAEGVESPSALALLRVMGCDLIQGYLIARPMPLADLIAFLASDRAAELADAPPGLARAENYW